MNSFALLQDDVEDANDLVPTTSKPEPTKQSTQEKEPRTSDKPRAETKDPSNDPVATSDDKDKPDSTPAPPKEKDMSFDEYQSQKAQLASGMASLNLKGARKANDGKGPTFENMSVLRKHAAAAAPDHSLMGSVPVKEIHENKALKDSTHAAVLKNAEIQSFFKRDPASTERRPYNGPRRGGDARRPDDARRGGFEVRRSGDGDGVGVGGGRGRGRGNTDRDGGRIERDYRRDQRGGYGGRGGGRGYRGDYGRGHNSNNGPGDGPNARPQGGRNFGNGPKVPMAPNVDDTSAFPSL